MSQRCVDDAAIWAAQLRDMPWEVICAFVQERGHVVRREPVLCSWCAMALDSLPLDYPPWAEDDVLPFDAEVDQRP